MRDAVDGMCSLIAFAPLDRAAATEVMRVFALSGCSPMQMLAALSAVKIVKGTRALIEAIAAQAKSADIRLKSQVRRVVQTGDGVSVELTNGDKIAARTALVTLPMNVLGSVEFEPGLSEIKRMAAAERHVGSGTKCYVHVKGDIGNVSVFAPEVRSHQLGDDLRTWTCAWIVVDRVRDGSRKRLPIDDVKTMQAALQRLLPGVEVERIFGWDWTSDPFAQGASGASSRPGQLSRLLPGLQRERRPLILRGSARIRRPLGAVSSTAQLKAAIAGLARLISI